jgi:hypothetical protein
MARTTCLICLVSAVCVCHIKTLEKQALVAGTKQSRQAVKATVLQGCQADKAVRLAYFAPQQAPLFFEVDVLLTYMF